MKPDNTQETIYVGLDTGLPPYLPYPRFLLKMDISQTAKLLYALLQVIRLRLVGIVSDAYHHLVKDGECPTHDVVVSFSERVE